MWHNELAIQLKLIIVLLTQVNSMMSWLPNVSQNPFNPAIVKHVLENDLTNKSRELWTYTWSISCFLTTTKCFLCLLQLIGEK